MKRAVSDIEIRRQPKENLPVDRNLLTNSVSYQNLSTEWRARANAIMIVAKSPLIVFWTPGYQYFPKSAKDSYEKYQHQMKQLKEFQENHKVNKKRKRRRKLFRRTSFHRLPIRESDNDSIEEPISKKIKQKKHGFIYNIFNKTHIISELDTKKRPNESSFHCFKRMLRADIILSAWDIDSTTIAENLTMIDKELFLKISVLELEMLLQQQSSENTANINALIIFAHRTSSLIAHEILKSDTERSRARLIARFINVANKCHRIANFQSCKTILSGLQSPAIYRLRKTWAQLRKKHATKYESFEILCRLYRDPRHPAYQKTFLILSQHPPFLPHIGDIIARLFGKIPKYDAQTFNKSLSRLPSIETTKSTKSLNSQIKSDSKSTKIPDIFNKIYRIFIGGGDVVTKDIQQTIRNGEKKSLLHRKTVRFKTLYEYYSNTNFPADFKTKNVEQTKLFLEKCQLGAIDYNFVVNNNAREYLLKSRYKDDKQNFYNSLNVELPYKFYD